MDFTGSGLDMSGVLYFGVRTWLKNDAKSDKVGNIPKCKNLGFSYFDIFYPDFP